MRYVFIILFIYSCSVSSVDNRICDNGVNKTINGKIISSSNSYWTVKTNKSSYDVYVDDIKIKIITDKYIKIPIVCTNNIWHLDANEFRKNK